MTDQPLPPITKIMPWKYTDDLNRVVSCDLSDGGSCSQLATSAEVEEWVANGNTIAPAC